MALHRVWNTLLLDKIQTQRESSALSIWLRVLRMGGEALPNHIQVLYIDQPNQVGFSYDVATNGTFVANMDDLSYKIIPWDGLSEVPETNLTTYHGTFSSQKPLNTANTTALAAHALWHFAQTWFFEFPSYKPRDDRISLWAESYGG